MSSIVVSGDTSGAVTLSAPAVAGTVTVTLPSASGTMAVLPTATGVLAESAGGTGTTTGYYGFKNRIINGAMVIDQRNAGASVTLSSSAWTFPVDRFSGYEDTDGVMTAQQVSDAPTGFINSIKFTATTADASLSATQRVMMRQTIEGLNLSDLAWGSANAATITISFWVKSSLTGTFGGSVQNGGGTRAYPFTYAISSANTWEQKSVTVAGDTTGTWLTTNGTGMQLMFGLGVGSTYSTTAGAWASGEYNSATGATSVIGTLNATWQVTGVQLEKGSTATAFDYRPYGTELALCQRYYQTFVEMIGQASGTTTMQLGIALQNEMRSTPSISATGACSFQDGVTAFTQSSFSYLNQGGSSKGINGYLGNFTGLTQFRMYQRNPTFGILTASAEL